MDTIVFDVDDTLYNQALPFKKAFRKQFQEPFTDEEVEKLFIVSRKHSDALFHKELAGEVSLTDSNAQRITAACQEFGMSISWQQAVDFQAAYLAEQQQITLVDEVAELIEALYQQKKQLAILTNGGESHQSMKIKQLQLARWIPEQHIFISGAIGHAKPAQAAFEVIEEKLQLDKQKTVYIGDSFDHDVIGAKQVGWHAIWMNHRHRSASTNQVKPDKVVYHAKELLDYFGVKIKK